MTVPGRQADLVIIGLGLAGAALAWRATARNLDVLIVDDAADTAASRVAAGLVTPLTGARLKPEGRFNELATAAAAHYRDVGRITGVEAYRARPACRVLSGPKELDAWRKLDAAGNPLAQRWEEALPAGVRSEGVAIRMPDAGRLAIADYVTATRDYFAERDALIEVTISDESVVADLRSVRLPELGITAGNAVFCRGFADHDNRYFGALGWRAAKGQILELDCPGFDERFTIHGSGTWLTASGAATVLAGATYEWDTLDATATAAARQQLTAKIESVVDLPFEIVGQRAAVRPIVEGRKPVIGQSALSDRVWLFNGLGSKGALFAPSVAQALLSNMVADRPIPPEWSLKERLARST